MRGSTFVLFSICFLVFTVSCSSSSTPTPKDSASGDTHTSDAVTPDATPAGDSASTQDSTPPVDSSVTDSATQSDGTTASDAKPGDSTSPDAMVDISPTDAEETDILQADTTQPPDTGSGCTYVCDIDCQCKKDVDGCDIPECESDACLKILTEANQLLADAAGGCKASSQCKMYDYPICGSFGCFQGPVNDTLDLLPLNLAAQQGVEKTCSGFHCGCMLPEAPTACFEGSCISCEGSSACSDCAKLTTMIEQDAAFAAAGCVNDNDCEIAIVDQCNMGPHIVCHGYAYNTSKGPGKVIDLMSLFTDPENGCPWTQCDCQASVVHCEQGKCVPGM